MSNSKAPEIKTINQRGEFVAETAPDAAFIVNLSDPDASAFIEGVKQKAGLESQVETAPVRKARRKPVIVKPAPVSVADLSVADVSQAQVSVEQTTEGEK